jgi:acyl-CoA thioester hydrolase
VITGRCRIRVRYSDTDAMAVAHHSRHVTWLEVGRLELMRSAGAAYEALEADGFSLPVIGLEMRYRAPARSGDIIEIETSMQRSSPARLAFTYRLTRITDGVLLATGRSEHAAVDRALRPVRLPGQLLSILEVARSYPVAEGPC